MANYSNNLGQIRLGWRTAPVFTPDGTPNTIDPDSTNFILASGIIDSLQISAIETLVADLKAYGLWTKMKAIYPFVGGSAASHKFNLKDPRDLNAAYRLVFNGGWIHSSNGAKPNGSTGYADTFFNPYTNLSNSTISNHLSTYIRENIDEPKVDIGLFSSSNGLGWDIETRISNTAYYSNLRGNNYIAFVNTDSRGLHINTRTTSTSQKVFINSTLKGTDTGSTTGTINSNVSISARYNTFNSSYEYRSSKEQAFVSIGDGLTDTDASNLYISVQKFQTTLGRHVGTPYVSDPDAITFLMAAGITDGTQAASINTLVIRMKADGVWTKMKAIYPFVGGSATSHKFNLKDPRDLDAAYRLVFNGGWIHSSNGALPNGTTGYADTKLVPSSVLSLNSTHVSYYSRTNNMFDGIDFGVGNAAYTNQLYSYIKAVDGKTYFRINRGGTAESNIAIADSRLFYMINRNSPTQEVLFTNTTKNIFNYNSTGLSNYSIFLGSINLAGTPNYYGNKESAFVSIGDGLTDTESANFYTSVQAYQTTLGRQVNIPVVSDTDAQSFLNAANITIFQQASAVNKLVVDLKAAGIWTKMKAIYPFVGGSANSHKFNLKDPRDLDAAYRLVFNGGWTHTGTGALPNGITGYADTKLNENSVMTLGSEHMSYYSRTNILGLYVDMGVWNASSSYGTQILTRLTYLSSDSFLGYVTDANSAYITNTDSRGFFMTNRPSISQLKLQKNSSISTFSSNVVNKVNDNFWIGARNINSNSYLYSPRETAFASIGDGLTDAEATSLYTAVQAYQTSLGRQLTTPIYNNGLVLNLDAGNANSYPGTGTTWFDLASGNNGTLTNGPTYDTTNGGSIVLDGVNDRVTSFPTKLPDISSKTIDIWFKSTSSVRQGLCGIRDGVNVTGWVFTINRTSTGNLTYFNTGQGTVEVSAGITTNTWYNAVLTHDYSTGVAKIYLNGKLLGTGNASGYNSSAFNGVIGDEDGSFTTPFKGNIPKVTMYNRVLTDTEVLNNFNSTRGRFGL